MPNDNVNAEANVEQTENKTSTIDSSNPVPVPGTAETVAEGEEQGEKKTYSMDDLLNQIAELRAEQTRTKKALDKATGEAADYKRRYQARQTEEERKNEEEIQKQTEHAQYVKDLEDFKKNQLAYNRYVSAGYQSAVAQKMADAEVKGDFDALNVLYKQVLNEQLKEEEKKLRAQSISGVNVGNSEGEPDPFLVGWNMVR